MTQPVDAKLAFLTDPAEGVFVFNVQEEGKELQRWRLNRDQMFMLNKQTADILLKAFK